MKILLRDLSDSKYKKLCDNAEELFKSGRCCPRQCGVGQKKPSRPCGALEQDIKVASFAVHTGEEPPVSANHGAGNIFFSGCTLRCDFCQNWPISHNLNGKIYSTTEFADKIIKLQRKGVHNINLTTGDHYVSHFLKSMSVHRKKLNVAVLFNCSGYIKPELLEILLKFCDGFLFDAKYINPELSLKYSKAPDYPYFLKKALDIFLQVDIPWFENSEKIMEGGLIIRHLVLPGHVENSIEIIKLLHEYQKRGLVFKLSLMSQYFPAYKADTIVPINRKVKAEEYSRLRQLVEEYDMDGWFQDI